MYTLFDTDSSFFNISVGGNKNITTDVLELSIVEEVGQLLNGTLMLNDPAWYYASLLRAGTTFNLSWGYKNRNQTMNEILIKIKNPDEVAGIGIRSGIKAIVTLPKFVFGNQGLVESLLNIWLSPKCLVNSLYPNSDLKNFG